MTESPNFGLSYLAEGQNGRARYNRMLAWADAFLVGKVLDRDLATPPGSPSAGDLYLVGTSPTGAWAGQAGKFALRYNSAWEFLAPKSGMQVFIQDEKAAFCYSGPESEWFPLQDIWSTSEHWTGKYGPGGGKVYAKCFESVTVPTSGTPTTTAHGITGIDLAQPVMIEGSVFNGSQALAINVDTGSARLYSAVDGTNITLGSHSGGWSGYTCDLRLEYQKT